MTCCVLAATSELQPNSIRFFLGASKDKLFSKPVPDLLMLKSRIQEKTDKIKKEMLQKIYETAFTRFHICIGNYHHLPNGILK